MADPPPYPDASTAPGPGAPPGMPRWVKVFGIIALVLVLLFVIMLLTGRGGHGPRRHFGSGDAAGASLPPSVTGSDVPSSGDPGGRSPPEGGR